MGARLHRSYPPLHRAPRVALHAWSIAQLEPEYAHGAHAFVRRKATNSANVRATASPSLFGPSAMTGATTSVQDGELPGLAAGGSPASSHPGRSAAPKCRRNRR
jgi:hypothetical protein